MKYFLRFLKYTVLFLILLVLAAVIFVWSIDLDKYKPEVTSAVQSALGGRNVSIGSLHVKKSFIPTLLVQGVTVANAPAFEAREPFMAKIGKIEVVVDLKYLFSGKIVVTKVLLQDASVFLQENDKGVKNWDFSLSENKKEALVSVLSAEDEKSGEKPVSEPVAKTIPESGQKSSEEKQTTGADVLVRDSSNASSFVLDRLSVDEIEIKNLLLTYQSAEGEKISLPFSRIDVADLKKISVEGVYLDIPYEMQAQVGNIKELAILKSPFPFSVFFQSQGMTLQAEGRIDNFQEPLSVSAKLTVGFEEKGIGQKSLLSSYGVLPFRAGLEVVLKENILNISDFVYKAQESSVKASGKVFLSHTPLHAEVVVKSDYLNISQVLDWERFGRQKNAGQSLSENSSVLSAGEADIAGNPTTVSEVVLNQSEKRNSEDKGRLFSSASLPFPLWPEMKVSVKADFQKIVQFDGQVPFFLKVTGDLTPVQVSANISSDFLQSRTKISFKLSDSRSLKSKSEMLEIQTLADIQDMKLQNVPPQIVKGAKGDVSLSADLSAKGNSVASLMASLDGTFLLQGKEISFQSLQKDKIPMSVLNFMTQLIPFDFKKQQDLSISCAVANLSVKQGMVNIPRTVAVQTSDFNLVLDGSVSLGKETMDLSFIPLSKKGRTTELAGIVFNLVQLKGTFLNPKIGFDSKGALSSLTTIGLGVMTSGLSVVGQEVLRQVTDDPNPCETALKGGGSASSQKGKEQEAKKPSLSNDIQDLGTGILKSIPSFLKGKK